MKSKKNVLQSLYLGTYRLTLHARKRMSERGISSKDIQYLGQNRYVEDQEKGKYKVTGVDIDGLDLTVICVDEDEVLIVTVY